MEETTRSIILAKALKLFSEDGYASVSMRALARSVGITPSSIYNHFSSKEELFQEVFYYFRNEVSSGAEIQSEMVKDLMESMDIKDLLLRIVKSYMSMYRDERAVQFWRMIHQDMFRLPEAADIIILETERMIGASRKLFSLGAAAGKVIPAYIESASLQFAYGIRSLLLEQDMRDRHDLSSDSVNDRIEIFIEGFCQMISKKK